MVRAGMTISDAAHEWVREMNAYPQDMIETLMRTKPDDWHEVTMPRVCDRVYVCNLPDGCEDYDPNGEVENIAGDVYLINLQDGNTVELGADDFEVERDSILPMWGWLWSFSDSADDYFGFNFNPHDYPMLYEIAREEVYGGNEDERHTF